MEKLIQRDETEEKWFDERLPTNPINFKGLRKFYFSELQDNRNQN